MAEFDRDRLADICRRYDVSRVRVFGSASRGEEGPDRPVDVLTEPGLSPLIRDSVLASASVIFDAAA